MANIISLHGQPFASVLPTPPEPVRIVHALRALFVANVIGKDAFFLGAQVLAQAQAHGVREVALSHEIAQKTRVHQDKTIFTGPVSRDRMQFVIALQELHFSARILNHYDAHRLDDADVADRHFTRNPDIGADSLWGTNSPIFFRLPDMSHQQYNDGISELYNAGLSVCTGYMPINMF